MLKSKSLQKQLILNLIYIISAFYVIAGLVSFYFAYIEAKEFQDDILKQVARYSGDTSTLPAANGTVKLTDDEASIFVFHLPHDHLPEWLNIPLVLGFQDVPSPVGKMRVYVNDDAQGRDIVAQLTEGRDELAINSSLRSLLPLLFLLPLIGFVVAQLVKKQFKVIDSRSAEMDLQTSSELKEIPIEGLPSEIVIFVSATNRLIKRVRSLLMAKARFISDASHELRTPITAIALQVDNLTAIDDFQELKERLIPLKESVNRTRLLADQLLTYSKYEARQPVMKNKDLVLIVKSLISELHSQAQQKSIEFVLNAKIDSIQSRTDELALRLLLGNIIHNAIKFSPENTEIEISVQVFESVVQIEILDFGPGIPSSEKDLVFEPFHRLVDSEKEGTGLGLSIAKECARTLKAQILLLDRQDTRSGLNVRVTLPLF